MEKLATFFFFFCIEIMLPFLCIPYEACLTHCVIDSEDRDKLL